MCYPNGTIDFIVATNVLIVIFFFQRIHPSAFEEYSQLCVENSFVLKTASQDDFDEALVKFVVAGGHEFSIVEETFFIALLKRKCFIFISNKCASLYTHIIHSVFFLHSCVKRTIQNMFTTWSPKQNLETVRGRKAKTDC